MSTRPPLLPRPVLAAHFGPKPTHLVIEATPEERKAIASAYGCLAVHSLLARLKISRRGDELRIAGMLEADVDQACVVTLEPVRARVREEIAISYAQAVERPAREGDAEEEVLLTGEEPPEPLIEGRAELGDALLQFFALALDPYPRKPGAEYSPPDDTALSGPFAALKRLKDQP